MPRRCMETQKLINEKSLQRYIYEIMTFGNKEKFKSLFPNKFKEYANKKVKIIIPEYPIFYNNNQNKHLADFRIIFNDNTFLNIEVEWQVTRFNHGKDVYDIAYRGTKGFLIVINNNYPPENYIEPDNISVIDALEFSFWFTRNSKQIIDGTISNYLPQYQSNTNKNWLIFLPSAGRNSGDSLNDYLLKGRNKGVWAFRYSNSLETMKNILDIKAGDTVIFVYNFTYGKGTRGRQFYHSTNWNFTGLDILKVKKGYYCDIYDNTFENEEWNNLTGDEKINSKLYMHYFQYYYPPNINSEKYFSSSNYPIKICNDSSNLPGWLEFIDKLRWSSSNQGAPVQITTEALMAIYSILGQL